MGTDQNAGNDHCCPRVIPPPLNKLMRAKLNGYQPIINSIVISVGRNYRNGRILISHRDPVMNSDDLSGKATLCFVTRDFSR